MTELLERAIVAKLKTLSVCEQDAIMEELEDDPRGESANARSPDALAKVAASAMAGYPPGKTQELASETLSIRLIQPTSVTGSKVTKKGECM